MILSLSGVHMPYGQSRYRLAAMKWELVLIGIGVVLGVAEFLVWYSEALWHKEDDRARGDDRNWKPPH